jgi:hypothetical protein
MGLLAIGPKIPFAVENHLLRNFMVSYLQIATGAFAPPYFVLWGSYADS